MNDFLTAKEMAFALRVCLGTVYRYTSAGSLRCVRVGNRMRFPRTEVLRVNTEGLRSAR